MALIQSEKFKRCRAPESGEGVAILFAFNPLKGLEETHPPAAVRGRQQE
jgi:hypothetical protein